MNCHTERGTASRNSCPTWMDQHSHHADDSWFITSRTFIAFQFWGTEGALPTVNPHPFQALVVFCGSRLLKMSFASSKLFLSSIPRVAERSIHVRHVTVQGVIGVNAFRNAHMLDWIHIIIGLSLRNWARPSSVQLSIILSILSQQHFALRCFDLHHDGVIDDLKSTVKHRSPWAANLPNNKKLRRSAMVKRTMDKWRYGSLPSVHVISY